jgi:hypothetical protein
MSHLGGGGGCATVMTNPLIVSGSFGVQWAVLYHWAHVTVVPLRWCEVCHAW